MRLLSNKKCFFKAQIQILFITLLKLFEVVQNAMVYVVSHASKSLRVTAKSLSLQSISTNYQSLTDFCVLFSKKYIRIFLARPYIPDQMIKVLPNG